MAAMAAVALSPPATASRAANWLARPGVVQVMVKEAVNAAYETTLSEGIHFERRLFHTCFGTNDQKEGMAAFVEKRPAKFTNS
jgi:enoyl-CoA hydratase